jgi:hypothetical protein
MFRYLRSNRSLMLMSLAMATAAAQPTSASAQFQFGRNANEPYSGRITVVNKIKVSISKADLFKEATALNKSSSFKDALANAKKNLPADKVTVPTGPILSVDVGPTISNTWQKIRPKLTDEVLKFLHEKNIGGGVRTSRNRLNLDENGELFVGVDGRGFTFRYVLRGNQLTTKLRTPGPLPSGTDPGFRVKFDMELLIDVDIQGTSLVVRPARLNMNVSRPTGTNITGSLVIAVADLVSTISGTDLIGVGLKLINGKEIALSKTINLEMSKLSPALAKAAQKGVVIPSFDKQHNRIVLTLMENTPGPVVR